MNSEKEGQQLKISLSYMRNSLISFMKGMVGSSAYFLDFQKTFESIHNKGLLEKLYKLAGVWGPLKKGSEIV